MEWGDESLDTYIERARSDSGPPVLYAGQGVQHDRYRIIQKLGEGGFGAVYQVASTADPSLIYAMKIESIAEDTRLLKIEV